MRIEENVIGKRLRWIREKKSIKQKDAASDLSLTPYQLSRYESGKSKPDPNLIAQMADYYKTTSDYLLGRSSDPRLTSDQERRVNKELEEVIKIIESLPEDKKKEKIDKILAYTKGITDADN